MPPRLVQSDSGPVKPLVSLGRQKRPSGATIAAGANVSFPTNAKAQDTSTGQSAAEDDYDTDMSASRKRASGPSTTASPSKAGGPTKRHKVTQRSPEPETSLDEDMIIEPTRNKGKGAARFEPEEKLGPSTKTTGSFPHPKVPATIPTFRPANLIRPVATASPSLTTRSSFSIPSPIESTKPSVSMGVPPSTKGHTYDISTGIQLDCLKMDQTAQHNAQASLAFDMALKEMKAAESCANAWATHVNTLIVLGLDAKKILKDNYGLPKGPPPPPFLHIQPTKFLGPRETRFVDWMFEKSGLALDLSAGESNEGWEHPGIGEGLDNVPS